MDQFRLCETHFTTYQRFVANQSAISQSSGGFVGRNEKSEIFNIRFFSVLRAQEGRCGRDPRQNDLLDDKLWGLKGQSEKKARGLQIAL